MADPTHATKLSPPDRELLDHLLLRVEEFHPGQVIDARGLYLPELWDELPPLECRVIGRRIASLVARRLLPLEPAGFNSARHNLYCRI